ncbi:hypothetical protein NE235_15150 [Actinoallomurus spadix]|uniref:CHAP domain-containing protein n=1 Tax=Actinoallomurus spadix TaxID=79912 RepID=A0ABP3FHG2_9ACTN|nr:hypothetical protein [Actinoallomurus spadix]MCO5987439.1 hypothetical protein [Actinoallomurus spadix]
MRRPSRLRLRAGAALVPAAVLIAAGVPATAHAAPVRTAAAKAPAAVSSAGQVSPLSAGDGTPAGAVQWMKNHVGSTGWEHYCEKAVENAYGTTGVWASAIAHWNGAPHHSGTKPPAGSFVYWNISSYGHVGIADGNGGFYSTSISGKIGHASSVSYFSHYLGWTPAAVPRQ